MAQRIRKHSTRLSQVHEAAVTAEFATGQRVMTIDGLPGRILFVAASFSPGISEYEVVLDGGMGKGTYTASQLRAIPADLRAAPPGNYLPAGVTASFEAEGAEIHVASDDYPEMGTVLSDRPDPGGLFSVIGLRKTAAYLDDEPATSDHWDDTEVSKPWHDSPAMDPPGREIHRGVSLDLPEHVHSVVHDESRSLAERGTALARHLLMNPHPSPARGQGLGYNWTDDQKVAKDNAEGGSGLGSRSTPVVMHAYTPGREDMEDDKDLLRERYRSGPDTSVHPRTSDYEHDPWSFPDADQREISMKSGSSVPFKGVSWARPGYWHSQYGSAHEDPGYSHLDFPEGMSARASATTYGRPGDPRDDEYNGGENDTGMYWAEPGQQPWTEDHLGPQEPAPPPPWAMSPALARLAQIEEACQFFGGTLHHATTINGTPIDNHGDAPEHGTVPRATAPDSYDSRSTEGAGDPKWDDPVDPENKELYNGATVGMYPEGMSAGGGPGLEIGAFVAHDIPGTAFQLVSARVPWTGHERTELHNWMDVPTGTDGDFVPSTDFTGRHRTDVPAEEVAQDELRATAARHSESARHALLAQLEEDYPQHALEWLHHAAITGPHYVPLKDIDWRDRDTWTSYKQPHRVGGFLDTMQKKAAKGEPLKPALAVATPGRTFIGDGHHRGLAQLLAAHAGDGPAGVWAYTATVSKTRGPWDDMHAQQIRAPSKNDDSTKSVEGADAPPEQVEDFQGQVDQAVAGLGQDEHDNPDNSLDDSDTQVSGPDNPDSSGSVQGRPGVSSDPLDTDPDNWPAAGAQVNETGPAKTQGRNDGKKKRALPSGEVGARSKVRKSAALAMYTAAAQSPSFGFEFTASWSDVIAKARRIRAGGHVRIVHASLGMVIGEVRGDHDIYESGIQRPPGKPQTIQHWACGCPWASFHQDKSLGARYSGRPCSHVMALQFEAQSRGMFGRQVVTDESQPSWGKSDVTVKSWPPYEGDPHKGRWSDTWLAPAASLHHATPDEARDWNWTPEERDEWESPVRGATAALLDDGEDAADLIALAELGGFSGTVRRLAGLASSDKMMARHMAVAHGLPDDMLAARSSQPGGLGEFHDRMHAARAAMRLPHTHDAAEPGEPGSLRPVTADQANAPWGSENVSHHPPVKPYGATEPLNPEQDPGSYGFLAAPDPDNWGGIQEDSYVQQPLSNEGHKVLAPGAAQPLPAHLNYPDIGSFQQDQETFGYTDRANTAGPSTSIEPRDPQGIRMEEGLHQGAVPDWVSGRWREEGNCERCGAPGETVNAGTGQTMCGACHQKQLEKTRPDLHGPQAELHDAPEPALPSTTGDDLEHTAAVGGTIGGGSAGSGQDTQAPADVAGLGASGSVQRRSGSYEGVRDRFRQMFGGPPSMGDLGRMSAPQARQPSVVTQEPGMGSMDEPLSPEDPSIQTVGGYSSVNSQVTSGYPKIGTQQWSGGGADSDEAAAAPGQPQGGIDDIVAAFQRSAAASQYTAGAGGPSRGGQVSDGDIAAQARAFLKTADVLPDAEAAELITEGRGQRARNLGLLRLEGTHYEGEDDDLTRRGVSLDDFDDDVISV
jgi:hypothetical protein